MARYNDRQMKFFIENVLKLIPKKGILEKDLINLIHEWGRIEMKKKIGRKAVLSALKKLQAEGTIICEVIFAKNRSSIRYKPNVDPSIIDLPQRSPQIMEGSEQLHSNIIKNEIGFGVSLPAFFSALPFASVIICDYHSISCVHCMKQVGTA